MQPTEKKFFLNFQDWPTFWASAACLFFIGGFVLWSAFAQLAEGVTASGQVVVEDNRKVVQHLEGGIIRTLHVKEGDIVEEGDVLVELGQIASLARRDEVANELAVELASIERLTSLLDAGDAPDFSVLDDLPIDERTRTEIIARQQRLFDQTVRSLDSEISVLTARRATQKARERDLVSQIDAVGRSLRLASDDLTRRLSFLDQKWETIDRVQASEREVASLEAELSALRASQNEARVTALEIDEEIKSAVAVAQARYSGELLEARRNAEMAEEKLGASQDVLSRTIITAPRSGKVLNLSFTTIGGVVGSGEPIMEIVPDTSDLVAQVQINPTDRDAVQPGQSVKAQLSAYKMWVQPRIDGEVLSISADLKQVPETGVSYYEARILLDRSTLKTENNIDIIPGMPVEAFIANGQKSTFAEILFEPIFNVFDRGSRVS
ncbi:HlyD family type I secretion periplasmic adaptor subunit [Parvularcula sp. IMCC14364]|uniref:HlyD family type I secretion periplasmic adaptor subunit n=1 Tax=Parvularcula sp. IMCC14364 TaxID=3067902 RepID=UPI0027405A5C|nr:HlyD family type I secretion periplasmic adaptor subunit [Parvularcula sp. IMCC14364]